MASDSEEKLSGKHLVIFGCGYVGTALATQAIARGLRVTALTRNPAAATVLREIGVEAVVGDLASEEWHATIGPSPEFALDCVSSGGREIENYRRSYVDGMTSIVTWAQRRGTIGTLVYTSSTSVYPQGGGAVVDETAPTAGAGERGAILLEAERKLREGSDACRRWFILRLAGIYGPGRHHLLEQVRTGAVAGVGSHRLNVVHRDDIASAVWACFEAPTTTANEVFNVADDAPAPKTEVVTWLASQLGLPAPRFTGEPVSTRRAVTPDRAIANARIKAVVGWRPRYSTYRDGYKSLLSR